MIAVITSASLLFFSATAMSAFLDAGDTAELAAYMEEYHQNPPDENASQVCEAYAVDLVVRHYLKMVRAVAEKYNGTARFEQINGVYPVSVLLRIPVAPTRKREEEE